MRTESHVTSPTAPPLPQLPTPEALAVQRKPNAELEELLLRGEQPDPRALVGWRFRGMNTPAFAKLLGIQKFMKGFYESGGSHWGYNVPVRQNGFDAPWLEKGKPFGFYQVIPVDPTSRDNAYLHSLLLDYGAGKNPIWDPSRTLRDYVVRVRPGSDDLLLGKAYAALGPVRIFAQSFFVLERHERSDFRR
jgi:hypothetical protein